jgi:hypothetical protein
MMQLAQYGLWREMVIEPGSEGEKISLVKSTFIERKGFSSSLVSVNGGWHMGRNLTWLMMNFQVRKMELIRRC